MVFSTLIEISFLITLLPKIAGFHASNPVEFAEKLHIILKLSHEESLEIRERARKRAKKVFSSEEFARRWKEDMWEGLETKLRSRREGRRQR